MKKTVLILCITAGLLPAGLDPTFSYSASDLRIQTIRVDTFEFSYIQMNGSRISPGEVGLPQLPGFYYTFILPPGSRVTGLTINYDNVVEFPLEHIVYPVQRPFSTDTSFPFVPPDISFYKKDTLYPGEIARVSRVFNCGGYTLAEIEVFPVRYNPAFNKLYIYQTVQVIINYDSAYASYLPLRQSDVSRRAIREWIKSVVYNKEDIGVFYTDDISSKERKVEIPVIMQVPSLNGLMPSYVIITSEAYKDSFREFAEWKTQKGYLTVIKTVEWIDANYDGINLAEKIRKFIQDAYRYWGAYFFVLGGDINIVPTGMLYGYYEPSRYVAYPHPSDFYYRDIVHRVYGTDYNFNADMDDTLGEWDDDDIDLGPDVFVGRISFEAPEELSVILQKIIDYERNPDTSYIKKMLMWAGTAHERWGKSYLRLKNLLINGVAPDSSQIFLGPNAQNPPYRPEGYSQIIIEADESYYLEDDPDQKIYLVGAPNITSASPPGLYIWLDASAGDTSCKLHFVFWGGSTGIDYSGDITVIDPDKIYADGSIDNYFEESGYGFEIGDTNVPFSLSPMDNYPYEVSFSGFADINDGDGLVISTTYADSVNFIIASEGTREEVELLTNFMRIDYLYNPIGGYKQTAGIADIAFYSENGILLKKDEVISRINQDYHILFQFDHCGFFFIGTAQGRRTGGMIRRDEVEGGILQNTEPFIFISTLGCWPNAYDYYSVSEALMRKYPGAVAVIANTRTGWEDLNAFKGLSKDMAIKLVDALYGPNPVSHIGKVLNAAVTNVDNTGYGAYNLNLLGCPEMPVWTYTPRRLSMTVTSVFQIGTRDIEVVVKDPNGVAVETALVCVYKKSSGTGDIEVYRCGYTDVNGVINFQNVNFETQGPVYITATYRNFLPAQEVINIEPVISPFISVSGFKFKDKNDNLPNPGEELSLAVEFKNSGNSLARGVEAEIIIPDPYIEVLTSGYVPLGDISPDSSVRGGYRIRISHLIRELIYDTVEVIANMRDAEGNIYSDKFYIAVYSDSLVHTGHNFVKVANAVIEYRICPKIANYGEGFAKGVYAILRSRSPYVVIVDSVSHIGDLAKGKEIMSKDEFVFILTKPISLDDDIFKIVIKDSFNREWVHNFDLVPPVLSVEEIRTKGLQKKIEIRWSSDSVSSDFLGWNIYGRREGGVFRRLNTEPLKSSIFIHEGLESFTSYEYYITCVDSSRNESSGTEVFSDKTNPDYQYGWPKIIPAKDLKYPEICGIKFADIDMDGEIEIITAVDAGYLYVWDSRGNLKPGFPRELPGGIGENISGYRIGIGDWDNDYAKEIFVIGRSVRVFDPYGNIEAEILPDVQVNQYFASFPVIADVNGDGEKELIIRSYKDTIKVYKSGNPPLLLWKAKYGWTWTTILPFAGNVCRDGIDEVIGFCANYIIVLNGVNGDSLVKILPDSGYKFVGSSFLADMDNDNYAEIIAPQVEVSTGGLKVCVFDIIDTLYQRVYEWVADTGRYTGAEWWKNLMCISPADLDNDSVLEIVGIFSEEGCYIFDTDFPGAYRAKRVMTDRIHAVEPLIGDIDHDGNQEIIFGTISGKIYVLRYNDLTNEIEEVEGFPIYLDYNASIYSTLSLVDVDRDNDSEIFAIPYDHYVFAWDVPSSDPSEQGILHWVQSRYDAENTGWYRGPFNDFHYGEITGDMVWQNEIYLYGDVKIVPGASLRILPGTRVYIMPYTDYYNLGIDPERIEIISSGKILSIGDNLNRVKFIPYYSDKRDAWYGIRISGSKSSILGTEIRGAKLGTSLEGADSVIIKNSVYKGNMTGINLEKCNNIRIISDSIIGNYRGIFVDSSFGVSIDSNYIYKNKGYFVPWSVKESQSDTSGSESFTGIFLRFSDVHIGWNEIIDNYVGVYGVGFLNLISEGNYIKDNYRHGMDLDIRSTSDVLIRNDTFIGNALYGRTLEKRYWNEFAGLTLGHRYYKGDTTVQRVEGCYFRNNLTGIRFGKFGPVVTQGFCKIILFDNRIENEIDSSFYGIAIFAGRTADSIAVIGSNNFIKGCDSADVYIRSYYDSFYVNFGNLESKELYNPGGNKFLDTLYSFINATPYMTYAQGNLWAYTDSARIDSTIYDDEETGGRFGKVKFGGFYIAGPVLRDTVWEGIVSIGGDLIIPQGVSVTIRPNTYIRFAKDFDILNAGYDSERAELIVRGNLIFPGVSLSRGRESVFKIQGKKAGAIYENSGDSLSCIFTSDGFVKEKGDWFGIVFENQRGNDKRDIIKSMIHRETEIKNANIEYAYRGIWYLRNANLEIKSVEIREIEKEGIRVEGERCDGKYDFRDLRVKNAEKGIWVGSMYEGEVENCVIEGNDTGFYFTDHARGNVKFSEIKNNEIGVFIDDKAKPSFGNDGWGYNKFLDNTDYHIYNNTTHTIFARNNYWGTMNVDSIKAKIYDKEDDPEKGWVKILPLWDGGESVASGVQGKNEWQKKFLYVPCLSDKLIEIKGKGIRNLDVKIFDISGRKVMMISEKPKKEFVIRRKLPHKGIYFFILKYDGKEMKRKILVVK